MITITDYDYPRSGYNQVPHLTQDTNGKVTNSQSYTKNVSQEVSPILFADIYTFTIYSF